MTRLEPPETRFFFEFLVDWPSKTLCGNKPTDLDLDRNLILVVKSSSLRGPSGSGPLQFV